MKSRLDKMMDNIMKSRLDEMMDNVAAIDEHFAEMIERMRTLAWLIDAADVAADHGNETAAADYKKAVYEWNQQLSWMRGILDEFGYFAEEEGEEE